MCILGLYTGERFGLLPGSWTAESLMQPTITWVRFIASPDEGQVPQEGVHFNFLDYDHEKSYDDETGEEILPPYARDWTPSQILFALVNSEDPNSLVLATRHEAITALHCNSLPTESRS